MQLVRNTVLVAPDMGAALATVKEALRSEADGERLVRVVLQLEPISTPQLAAWRQVELKQLVDETARLESHRQLQALQRSSGLSAEEVHHLARFCGVSPASSVATATQPSTPLVLPCTKELGEPQWLLLSLDRSVFQCIVQTLLPQWNARSPFVNRLFELFCLYTPDVDAATSRGVSCKALCGAAYGTSYKGASLSAQYTRGPNSPLASEQALPYALPSPALGEAFLLRLSFAGLINGLGWLLRGTSRRRAHLCYLYFACGPRQAVRRADFISGLSDTYALYHKQECTSSKRLEEALEAAHFVEMMFELWDGTGSGELAPQVFIKAAHQHPLLVQVFNLEQLETSMPQCPLPPPYTAELQLAASAKASAETASTGLRASGRGAPAVGTSSSSVCSLTPRAVCSTATATGSCVAPTPAASASASSVASSVSSAPPARLPSATVETERLGVKSGVGLGRLSECLGGISLDLGGDFFDPVAPGESSFNEGGLLLSPSNLNFLAEEYFAQPG